MWVFGYGSLMWDSWEGSFRCLRREEAQPQFSRRDFNKASVWRWGSPSAPGPTLGLEPDASGSCTGLAFEFPDDRPQEIIAYLKKREGADFILEQGTVTFHDGNSVNATIPTNNRSGPTYIGHKTIAERAAMAKLASGKAGRCSDYVANIRDELRKRGIDDLNVENFWRALCGSP
jgi:cation transport protein ChaC